MIDTNYKIEALDYLLDKECLSKKYYPLIPFKNEIISFSNQMGYATKNDLEKLNDEDYSCIGLSNEHLINLFRNFLKLYDPRSQKFNEIEKLDLNSKEKLAFFELYHLPGVKLKRATLYYYAGYESLESLANAKLQEVLVKTTLAISTYQLPYIVPLPKEVRTHIAVAKAFTER